MIETSTLKFLKELEKNNNRDWFQANKKAFEAAQDNVTALAGYLIGEIGKFDSAVASIEPKSCVFRIYRDIRFSKDKSPYKTNLGAYISPGGRKSMQPGYYIHIQPGQCFVAAGKHMPDATELLKVRTAIAANPKEFLGIVEKRSFREKFGVLHGERLSRPPKGFSEESPAIEYLKLKSFTIYSEYKSNKLITSSDFPKTVVKDFKAMFPLMNYLRRALA
ncbi:MAG TPA: DUF2461 domain-containing protein [Pyrinomonadaceae bacterium]|nr:DUF2461 domain-containing protein [Pyrinomonadaceae bacterium]